MKICLVGNQNSGKTTLFNALTGMNQKIGNWPGVTIERKTGIIQGTDYELVDLPGIYSLTPYTQEEEVSSNYILTEKPDIIINIVDATCLERSLYLTTQLLELNTKVIIALNMADVLSQKGIMISIQTLQEELKSPVCKISALKQTGIEELIATIIELENCKKCGQCWYVFKNTIKKDSIQKNINIEKIEEEITQRYKYISKITAKCIIKKKRWITTTETLDKIFLNKIFAIPIFITIMFSIYFLSVGVVGKYTSSVMEEFMQLISNTILKVLKSIATPEWLQSLAINGAIKGITAVLLFVPQLVILFACISILESTGYMSRIAFLLDNIFRKVGLSGKALIPFIIGSGCSVPGIMSTKIIENSDERKMTSILVPFIPCSAKLPIIALFSGYFFGENAGLVSISIYFLAILIIILSSILMRKFVFFDTSGAFISELPDYKLPNFQYVLRDVVEKTFSFIKRAGTTILFASIIIWFLLSFSTKLEYGVHAENSILAALGKNISWVFYPILGVNSWQATVSAIQGLIAKEQVISSMAIISGLEEKSLIIMQGGNVVSANTNNIFLPETTFGFFNQASAYAFVIFNLFSAPCFAAIATMKKELGGFKKMLMAIAYQTAVAWILATIIYRLFLLIF